MVSCFIFGRLLVWLIGIGTMRNPTPELKQRTSYNTLFEILLGVNYKVCPSGWGKENRFVSRFTDHFTLILQDLLSCRFLLIYDSNPAIMPLFQDLCLSFLKFTIIRNILPGNFCH
jgi:hypothetical protein